GYFSNEKCLTNHKRQALELFSEAQTLTDKKVWQGSHYADFPEIIEDGDAGEFTNESVTDDADIPGPVAGLVCRDRDGTK
ncbi:hypothetical protein Goklo_012002, partial [Gossypium klotzschianum]|nr:hypothetical protein [Gossypium klotzschianum]